MIHQIPILLQDVQTSQDNDDFSEPGSSVQAGCSKKQTAIECPICFQKFPLKLIEDHAAICRIPEDPVILSDDDVLNDEESHLIDHNYATCQSKNKKDVKVVLTELNQKHVDNGKWRIRIRRHKVFDDWKKCIEKPWNKDHEREIIVEFTGESAVDDGGPKREFLHVAKSCFMYWIFYLFLLLGSI